MTLVLPFFDRQVLDDLRLLERGPPSGTRVDEAAIRLVDALVSGRPCPSWTVTALLRVVLRDVDRPIAVSLAKGLGMVRHLEVRAVGLGLVQKCGQARRLGRLLLRGQDPP